MSFLAEEIARKAIQRSIDDHVDSVHDVVHDHLYAQGVTLHQVDAIALAEEVRTIMRTRTVIVFK